MTEWFQAGYFNMSLMVKRGCDSSLLPLGDLIKRWDRVPFTPGPTHPPIIVRRNPSVGTYRFPIDLELCLPSTVSFGAL